MKDKLFKMKLGLVAVLCLVVGAEAWAQPFQRDRQRQYQRNNGQYQRNNTQYQRQQRQYYRNENQIPYQDRRHYEGRQQYQYNPQDQYYHQTNQKNRSDGFLTPGFESPAERDRRTNHGYVNRVPYNVPYNVPYDRRYYRGY